MRVVGPMLWEPGGPLVEPPPGDGPVVLVAPSTSQDPSRLAAAGVPGRAGGRAGAGDRDLRATREAPANAVLVAVDVLRARRCRTATWWSRHGGHGTLARALASRLPGARLPGGRRHGRERGARGLGGRRRAARAALLHALGRAAGGAAGAGHAGAAASGRRSSPRWACAHPGPATAATQLERWAATVERVSYAAACGGAGSPGRAAPRRCRSGRVRPRPGRCRRPEDGAQVRRAGVAGVQRHR